MTETVCDERLSRSVDARHTQVAVVVVDMLMVGEKDSGRIKRREEVCTFNHDISVKTGRLKFDMAVELTFRPTPREITGTSTT